MIPNMRLDAMFQWSTVEVTVKYDVCIESGEFIEHFDYFQW